MGHGLNTVSFQEPDLLPPNTPAAVLPAAAGHRVRPVYWVISIGLAVILLVYSIRGIEWSRVGAALLSARPAYVLAAIALFSAGLFLRAYRWRILLSAEGPIDVAVAFWATSAGYLGNNFLPARAGEVVRTLIVSTRCGLSKTFVFTTAISERVTDAIVLVAISAAVLLTVQSPPGWLGAAAKPLAIGAMAAVTVIILAPRFDRLFRAVITRIPVPISLRDKLLHGVDQVLLGVRAYHDARRLLGFIGVTVLIWCMDAGMTVVGANALHLRIPVSVAFLLIAGLGIGSALPSTPGYVGIYQFVAVSILVPFGFSRTDAILYILFAQALSYAVIGSWGMIGLWKMRGVTGKNRYTETPAPTV